LLALKVLVQDAGEYRQDIERLLSSQLSAEVHLVDIQGDWEGWQPVLSLKGLSVDAIEQQPGLSLAVMDAVIQLDPAASIKAFAPIFSKLDIDGTTLRYDLSKSPEGGDSPDAEAAGKSSSRSGALTFLLNQNAINLNDTRIVVKPQYGQEISVSPIQLSFNHDDVLKQLKIDADLLTGNKQASIKFVAEVEGSASDNPVDFYLKIEGLNQAQLNPWLNLANIKIDSMSAEQEVWGQSQQGRLSYLTGRTSITDFQYQDYVLEQFTVQTALIRRDIGYQLQITDFVLDAAKSEISIPQISMDFERDKGAILPRRIMLDRIDLGVAANWLLKQPSLPSGASIALDELLPTGIVKNLLISWPVGAELSEAELSADLENVGIDAWDDIPAIKGINGLVVADRSGGNIHLESQDFAMQYPTLFDYRWDYHNAKGVVGWRLEDEGVVVASQLLNLSNDDLNAAGRFSIYLPFANDEQPLLNLQIGLQNTNGLQAKFYTPPKEVGVETYNWLVKAIKKGHVKRAGFVLNGVTRSRLPNYQLPVVQMFFDVNDASFEYQSGWPQVANANAFVFFRNGELIVEAQGGEVYDSPVEFSWVHLPQSADKIFVVGAVEGVTHDLQRLLTQSDLKDAVGDGLDDWEMSGQAATLVNLAIPLNGEKEPSVSVETVLSNAGFRADKEKINFTDITGKIKFNSQTGLSANKITAQLFDRPVNASISTKNEKTQIALNSHIATNTLREWLGLDLLAIFKGELPYSARLDMCPGKSCNQLVIQSDLKGVTISAPAPFGKAKLASMPLTVISDLGVTYSDERTVVRINLADQLRGVMVNDDDTIERAGFSLGGAKPLVPVEKGVWVDGRLTSVDYAELETFLTTAGLLGSDKEGSSTDGVTESKLRQVDLFLNEFSVQGKVISDLALTLAPAPLGWMINADSSELSGRLWLPEDTSKPYKVDLQYLNIRQSEDAARVNNELESEASSIDIDPSSLPSVDFKIASLSLDEYPLGRWSFKLRPTKKGATVNHIKANMEGAEILGELRWENGPNSISDLTLKLKGDDFTNVLKTWKLHEAIESKKLDSYLQLSWDGAPWAFELGSSNGELQFTAEEGRILDVGKSGNILRVFGILSLQSLGRRLRLDFTDLVKTGVAFDEMKASYTIKEGIAYTSSPFVMTGPSANIAMQGYLNLVDETVEKDIEVAIPVTGNIPLVSVLLGAPQVAGAVFLFDKLIGDPLADFTTVKYHLSGDWSDPLITIDQGEPVKSKESAPSILMDDRNG
tara:strand:+ start:13522 stop:17310 length:3789 start_codon:yes stop_codon:yes gene_type:complete